MWVVSINIYCINIKTEKSLKHKNTQILIPLALKVTPSSQVVPEKLHCKLVQNGSEKVYNVLVLHRICLDLTNPLKTSWGLPPGNPLISSYTLKTAAPREWLMIAKLFGILKSVPPSLLPPLPPFFSLSLHSPSLFFPFIFPSLFFCFFLSFRLSFFLLWGSNNFLLLSVNAYVWQLSGF